MPVVKKSSWRVDYEWSASSGLRIGQADYQGIRVLHTASVPFVYVNYAGNAFGPFTDELRSVSRNVEVRDIMHGFDLKGTYDSYGEDYQYEHVWRFHDDGQFAAKIVVHGPGEEIHGKHVYNIPFRFDLDLSGESNDSFQRRLASGRWSDIAKEGRFPPGGTTGYQWRVVDRVNDRHALIRPGFGDFGRVMREDGLRAAIEWRDAPFRKEGFEP